jgi:hypothetical protein
MNVKGADFDARRAKKSKLYADITRFFCEVWRKIRPLKEVGMLITCAHKGSFGNLGEAKA